MESTPLNSDLSSLSESVPQKSSIEQEICLSFDEAIKKLPEFLQSEDEQENNELAAFLSQVDQLHKPVVAKISAISIFNNLQHMIEPATHASEGVLQVAFPEQLPLYSQTIATEIAANVVRGVDLHNITMSVLNVLKEHPWEIKAALMITTFVLTFGDNGLNLCGQSKVLVNDIKMFARIKGGYEHQLKTNIDNIFSVVVELVASIVKFENLPTTLMTSKDPEVKVERTNFIVSVYWIIRTIVAAATSHIIKTSSRGYEFKTTISTLGKLPSRWTKNFEVMIDITYLEKMLLRLQDLLKEDIDIEAYDRIKKIVKQETHNDNMEVLNVLISKIGDVPPLYDCLHKRKVDLHELKGEYVLLFISELENITLEVEETKLNEFIDSFDSKKEDQIECKIVWIPLIDRSKQHTETSLLKPFLEWYYLVHYAKLLKATNKERNFKGWYSIGDPSMISNEVKKLFRDEWNYMGEPIIVVLDPQGNIVHLNAIHMFYSFGGDAFPFTRGREEELCENFDLDDDAENMLQPLIIGLGEFHKDCVKRREVILYYGGEDIEWIRSVTRMVGEISGELGETINMVYVGRSHREDLVRIVNEEKLSHCLSDPILLWLFWKRLHSYVYSMVNAESLECGFFQLWLDWDKSNAGWALLFKEGSFIGIFHEKVVLHTLKEFNLWKENALEGGFAEGFDNHYMELYKKILPCLRCEYPTDALNEAPETMECFAPFCKRRMEKYTTFVCYHGRR